MADKPKARPVKLTITTCSQVYSGKNSKGDDYTIYEVTANRENGEPIGDKKLRSFEDLPTGELLDLTVTPFNSDKYGLSYTLARKGGKVSSHQRINELQAVVTDLGERVRRLETAGARGTVPAASPPPAPAPVAQDSSRADLDERFGAAPPF